MVLWVPQHSSLRCSLINLLTQYRISVFWRPHWSRSALEINEAIERDSNQTVKSSNSVNSIKQQKNQMSQSSVCMSLIMANTATAYLNVWQSHQQVKCWVSLPKVQILESQFHQPSKNCLLLFEMQSKCIVLSIWREIFYTETSQRTIS